MIIKSKEEFLGATKHLKALRSEYKSADTDSCAKATILNDINTWRFAIGDVNATTRKKWGVTSKKKKKKKNQMQFRRLGKYSIEEIMALVPSEEEFKTYRKRGITYKEFVDSNRAEFHGHMVKMTALRFRTFRKHLDCVCCGTKASYFALEFRKGKKFNDKTPHFNMYGINKNGNEVLMTKDHIIPKSKGGPDHIDNMQTMCTHCNRKKGNKLQ